MPWLEVKRWVDTAAVVTGLATAVTVAVQLYDLNHREEQKKIEEWQTAVVYQVIENGRDLSFEQISSPYVIAAQKSELAIPKTKLADGELRLVLVRLIQAQAIIENASYKYSPKTYADPLASIATAMAVNNDMVRNVAKHVAIGWQSLSVVKQPITVEELQDLMIKNRGSERFLRDNMPVVLQQMQVQRYARLVAGGRVMPGDASGTQFSLNEIPPELQPLKGQLDPALFRLVITTDAGNPVDICFPTADNWAHADEYRKAQELGLISWSDLGKAKGCYVKLRVTPSQVLASLQAFAYGIITGGLGPKCRSGDILNRWSRL